MTLTRVFLLFLMFFSFALKSEAYLTLGESAEILPQSSYRFGFEPQVMMSQGGGSNWGAFFDLTTGDSTSFRSGLHTGKVDFGAFASFKYVPFPDVGQQPAMGLRSSVGYTRSNNTSMSYVQLAPLLSKKFRTYEWGALHPYFAIPLTFHTGPQDSRVASNLTFGGEVHPIESNYFYWGAEVSFDLNQSFSYISAFILIPIESKR